MFGLRVKVFVSATSGDFVKSRLVVSQVLSTSDIQAVEQHTFPPDFRSVADMLRNKVSGCDAVICLVGTVYGAEPDIHGPSRRSYTQLEYDMARELDKKVFVFFAADEFYIDKQLPAEDVDKCALQKRHKDKLASAHVYTLFSSDNELAAKIKDCVLQIYSVTGWQRIHYRTPPSPPRHFAGRVVELEQLRVALGSRTPGVIAVLGMSGQGKSTLAYQALNDKRANDIELPLSAGYWCSAGHGNFSFDMFLDEALTYFLEGKFDKRDMADPLQRMNRLLGFMQQRPVLVVIDAAERWLKGWQAQGVEKHVPQTVEERRGIESAFDEFLKASSGLSNGSHVLLTSRALPAILDQSRCKIVPIREDNSTRHGLDGLDPEASVVLLRELGVLGAPEDLRRTAALYDYLPIALEVLAGLLASEYGGRLDRMPEVTVMDPHHQLLKLLDETRAHLPGGAGAEHFMKIASHSLENPTLNALSDCCDDMPAGEAQRVRLLRREAAALDSWRLLKFDGGRDTIQLHPVIKRYFLELTPAAESARIHRRYSKWYSAQPIAEVATSLDDVSARRLAIDHALLAGQRERCHELFFERVNSRHTFVEWLRAFGHLAVGIRIIDELKGVEGGAATADYRIVRGAFNRELGRLPEAIADLDHAIAFYSACPDPKKPGDLANLAGALVNRANVQRQAGTAETYRKSLDDYGRAIAVLEPLAAGNPAFAQQLASVRMNRGNSLRDMGHLNAASDDCGKAVEIWERIIPKRLHGVSADFAAALTNRGNCHADLLHHEAALKDFESAERIYDTLLRAGQTEHHQLRLRVKILHGITLQDCALQTGNGEFSRAALADFEASVPALEKLVETRKELEWGLALAWMNRAVVHFGLQNPASAAADCRRAASTFSRLIDAGWLDLQGYLTHALLLGATVYHDAGDLFEAESSFARGRELAALLLSEGHTDLRPILVRYIVGYALGFIESDLVKCVALFNEAGVEHRNAIEAGDVTDMLRVVTQIARDRVRPHEKKLTAAGFNFESFLLLPCQQDAV